MSRKAATRRSTGTPKLTVDLRERCGDLIAAGCTQKLAARAVGIGERTFELWMERGKSTGQADRPYALFRQRILQARAECEGMLVAALVKSAHRGSVQAATWLLERGFTGWERPSAGGASGKNGTSRSQAPNPDVDPFEELDELAQRRQARAS